MQKGVDFKGTKDVEIRRVDDVEQIVVPGNLKAALLAKGEKIFCAVGFGEPGDGETWHTHADDFEETLYIVQGQMELEWETEDKQLRKTVVRKGDMLYFPPGIKNRFVNTGRGRLVVIAAGPLVRSTRKDEKIPLKLL